ncbi:hypothetical protein FOL88_00600 [Lactobacillus reuteri]|uniref:DNA polymerase III subunit beta family protein n=1 Tax=Limosilactobacillus reuteri TaxID=1598 RepID=UPI00146B211B|nr:hypothetical protein [Limosilactobacillus reuteri]NMV53539.1 hypothetical protein [Limosilactobacillus reuteri]
MNTQTLLNNVATSNVNEAIIVNAKEFLKALKFVAVATSKTSSRPTLQYVHIEINSESLTIEATDSHQLSQLKLLAKVNTKLVGKEFLIDGKFAKNLSKTPTKHGAELTIIPGFTKQNNPNGYVKIIDGNNEIFVDDNSQEAEFTRQQGFYPELDFLIPNQPKFEFETQKQELLPLLKELKKGVTKKENFDVHMEIQDNNKVVIGIDESIFRIEHENLVIGEKYLVDNNHGMNFEIDFNINFLIGLLQKCDNRETLKFSFSGTLRPFTFTRENGGIGLITPLRTFH